MKSTLSKVSKMISALAKNYTHEKTSAVILVAGKGTRAGGEKTKQLTEIDGIPVAIRTILTFQRSDVIDEIIIVASEKEVPVYSDYIEKYSLTKVAKVISGGACRAESAKKGFYATDKKAKFVAIHDGARCAVTTEQIEAVARAAYKHGAAIAATQSTDTIKRADKEGFVAKTVDRRYIWRAQTPQIFLKSLYEVALAKAGDAYVYATDDASLAEASGFKVKLVECGNNNIKITYKEDFERIRHIIDMQEKEGENK